MLQCLLIFALQTLLMFCFVRFYFVFFECKLYVYKGMRDFFAMGYLSRFIVNRVRWKMKIETISWWISGFILLHLLIDPLSLNLHLRFYTMVDRKFEQHWCFTINYLFICTKDYYPLIEWWMNWICVILHTSMIYNMPPWCQRELLFRQWMLR